MDCSHASRHAQAHAHLPSRPGISGACSQELWHTSDTESVWSDGDHESGGPTGAVDAMGEGRGPTGTGREVSGSGKERGHGYAGWDGGHYLHRSAGRKSVSLDYAVATGRNLGTGLPSGIQ